MKTLKSRIKELEQKGGDGCVVVFRKAEETPDEAVTRYCTQHSLARERQEFFVMDLTDEDL